MCIVPRTVEKCQLHHETIHNSLAQLEKIDDQDDEDTDRCGA